jgi:single-strand DNA-binding protein
VATVNVNVVSITGNLTRDPEVRSINGASGPTSVCSLGVAVNDRPGQNQQQGHVNFFDVTVWGPAADACGKYLTKGRPVAISGRLRQRRWDAQDGGKRSAVEIVADNVQFLNQGQAQGQQNGNGPAAQQQPQQQQAATAGAPDDIPF